MVTEPKPTYRYHREDVSPPNNAEHPNAMACPKCGVPVWQSAPQCHECGVDLDTNNTEENK